MREALAVHIGQTGCAVGVAVWKNICQDHGIDPSGRISGNSYDAPTVDDPVLLEANLERYFSTVDDKHIPRAIFIDDAASATKFGDYNVYGHLFNRANLVFEDPSQLWTNTLPFAAIRQIRTELEAADHPTSIAITHSTMGRIGGSVTLAATEHLSDLAPKLTKLIISQLPGQLPPAHSTLEILNSCLTLAKIQSDVIMTFDNDSLFNIALNLLEQPKAPLSLLNDVVAATTLGPITAPTRFPYSERYDPNAPIKYSELDIPSICQSLLPLPSLPFAISGFSPLTSIRQNVSVDVPSFAAQNINRNANQNSGLRSIVATRNPNIRDLCRDLFKTENITTSFPPSETAEYVKAMALWRGKDATKEEILRQMSALENHSVEEIVHSWVAQIPRRVHCYSMVIPPPHLRLCVSFFGSTTAFAGKFGYLRDRLDKCMLRGAFIHQYEVAAFSSIFIRYEKVGVEISDFIAASNHLTELESEYEALGKLLAAKKAEENNQIKMLWS